MKVEWFFRREDVQTFGHISMRQANCPIHHGTITLNQ